LTWRRQRRFRATLAALDTLRHLVDVCASLLHEELFYYYLQHAERSARHHKTPYASKSTRARVVPGLTKRPQGGTPQPPRPASSHASAHLIMPHASCLIDPPPSSSPPHASHTSKSHSSQHHHPEPRLSARPHPPSHVRPAASVSRLHMRCPA
jgi:hypothetical protein